MVYVVATYLLSYPHIGSHISHCQTESSDLESLLNSRFVNSVQLTWYQLSHLNSTKYVTIIWFKSQCKFHIMLYTDYLISCLLCYRRT